MSGCRKYPTVAELATQIHCENKNRHSKDNIKKKKNKKKNKFCFVFSTKSAKINAKRSDDVCTGRIFNNGHFGPFRTNVSAHSKEPWSLFANRITGLDYTKFLFPHSRARACCWISSNVTRVRTRNISFYHLQQIEALVFYTFYTCLCGF